MRMKLFLAILFAAFSLPLFAQSGGIKGVVVSRAERALIDDARRVAAYGLHPERCVRVSRRGSGYLSAAV